MLTQEEVRKQLEMRWSQGRGPDTKNVICPADDSRFYPVSDKEPRKDSAIWDDAKKNGFAAMGKID